MAGRAGGGAATWPSSRCGASCGHDGGRWLGVRGRSRERPGLGFAVVGGDGRAGVFGVVDAVDDQLPDVVVLQLVEDLGAFPSGPDQPGHPQLRQMLGHRRARLADRFGQLVDRLLAVDQRPQDLDAGAVGEHPEHLDRQRDLILRQPAGRWLTICIHKQIVARRSLIGSVSVALPARWCPESQSERALALGVLLRGQLAAGVALVQNLPGSIAAARPRRAGSWE